MEVTASARDGALVLAPHGRIDHASADGFAQALAPHLSVCTRDAAPCVLDMAGVDYISSAGLRVLMQASRQVQSQGGTLVVAALTPLVREVFQISRFDKVLEVFDDLELALSRYRAPG